MDRFAGFVVGAMIALAGTTAAFANGGAFDLTICFTGSSKVIKFDDQHVAFAWLDEQGFAHSAPPGGPFDMMWFRCPGSGGVFEGRRPIDDYCEFADKDGDKMFVIHRNVTDLTTNTRESKVDILAGTGKYTGIKGTGESQPPVVFPDDDPDRYARCVRWNGDYKIP